ncbi:hypothetical protein SERLA73DRAFT_74707 [Serpula lacrymans var. lacrymans S7.3]|uniref:Uncharacterized protein n=2 Tax=Serpula lacrymans var. lacrymans TaxID=341189 RepID=F8Q032_SERL3|nr:uncharacterized protein SERLADRAFT_439384 [Serpula lacrymans var. lacrymans S7.9]EGN98504.1 hypothetical protein SERLA73DRAFT_74707 [Serpula lacrymans var. lacrymans S7.3]EGO24078.1 hypothetical protein SERLADRAFT_439384 [Serpula lacrymans var. lacrymans S7.9]
MQLLYSFVFLAIASLYQTIAAPVAETSDVGVSDVKREPYNPVWTYPVASSHDVTEIPDNDELDKREPYNPVWTYPVASSRDVEDTPENLDLKKREPYNPKWSYPVATNSVEKREPYNPVWTYPVATSREVAEERVGKSNREV